MLDAVRVRVLGPSLLRESCELQLRSFPGISVVPTEARVVVAFALSRQDSLDDLKRSLGDDPGPTRTVLVLEPDPGLHARALALGVRAFVDSDDRSDILAQAVRSAALDTCCCPAWVMDLLNHTIAGEGQRPSRGLEANLTSRQLDCAILAARGSTYREIADELFIHIKTVKSHLHAVYTSLSVADKKQLRAQLTLLEVEREYRRRLDLTLQTSVPASAGDRVGTGV